MIKHAVATLAFSLSLASSPVHAQDTNCDGWVSRYWDAMIQFWEAATPETVVECLGAGASVNARTESGQSPLHLAAAHNKNTEAITALLGAGSDVHIRDANGATPLAWAAAINENPNALTLLINAGAEVNLRMHYEGTPLHAAAAHSENPEVITTLLNSGADGAAVNDDGETPFDLAKKNEALIGTDAYWALNDARFK